MVARGRRAQLQEDEYLVHNYHPIPRVFRLLAMVLLLLGTTMLMGCAGWSSPLSTSVVGPERSVSPTSYRNLSFAVPTSSVKTSVIEEAGVIGSLGEGVVSGSECLWLETSKGRLPVVWETGYSGRLNPPVAEVIAADRGVVATEGQTVVLGGGLGRANGQACMLGQRDAWYAQGPIVVS